MSSSAIASDGRIASRGSRRPVAGLAIVALCAASPAAKADDPKSQPERAAPRTFALLVGCTEYPELRKQFPEIYKTRFRLEGCTNDVELMRATLTERFGVPSENIVTLAGWPEAEGARPTEANVRKALVELGERTYAKGDRVIVHYAGHGVQQPDDNGDEADGLDEAWLLADGHPVGKSDFAGTLRDDELGRRLRAIRDRGASVWCIMDCCHSATGMRGASDPGARTRGIDPASLGMDVRPAVTRGVAPGHQSSPMDEVKDATDGLVVFYAAQSFQEVPEVTLPETGRDRKSFGLLTSAVARGLRQCGDALTFTELFEQVVAGYRVMGKHQQVQPLAEGDLRRQIFGGGNGMPAPLFVRRIGDGLDLSGGALYGILPGTELDVYAAGSAGDAAHRLGRVVVSDLRAESSGVQCVAGTDAAWAKSGAGPWPAAVTSFEAGDTGLALALVDESNRPVAPESLSKDVRAVLDEKLMRARFPPEADPAHAKWVLVTGADHEPIALAPALKGRGAPRFEVDARSLERTLLTVYRGENLLRFTGREMGRLPGNLNLEIRLRSRQGASEPILAGRRVPPGSRLDFQLVKTGAVDRTAVESMDVFVFWIDSHYGVDMLFPEGENSARLGKDDISEKGGAIRVGRRDGEETTDVSQGEERIVVFASPKRADAPPLDLSILKQDPLVIRTRGAPAAPPDGVAGLLGELAFGSSEGTRGVRKANRAEARLFTRTFTFQTGWGALHEPAEAKDDPRVRVERPAAGPSDAGAPPDAWALGSDVRLARAANDGAYCLLVARSDGEPGATSMLVDVDGDVPAEERTKEGLASLVARRSFDAEIAVKIERAPRRTVVWYDSNDDGAFDRVLIDTDDDLRADERYRLVGGKWIHDVGIDVDLLNTVHLEWLDDDARSKVLARLRTIAGD